MKGRCIDEADGLGNIADRSFECKDIQSNKNHISDKENNLYAPLNELIESLDMPIQKFGGGTGGCCRWRGWGRLPS